MLVKNYNWRAVKVTEFQSLIPEDKKYYSKEVWEMLLNSKVTEAIKDEGADTYYLSII